eukprot:8656866-Heterocapsa_arctica.AAC.1
MFHVMPRERICIAQLRWGVSLWEKFFPRIKSQRSATPLEPLELGEGSSTTEGSGYHTNGTVRNRTILTTLGPTPAR